MSIPTSFNPLGTLGTLELLDSVHVSCAEDEPYENLIETAFGEPYYLEPFSSEGYFAEVEVENVNKTIDVDRRMIVSVGNYSNQQIGSLFFFAWVGYRYGIGSVPRKGAYIHLVDGVQFRGNFNLHHKVENGVYSAEAGGRTLSGAMSSWTAADNTRMALIISKTPEFSYDFKKLVAHTENVDFKALPAHKGGKDGIAIFINDRLEKFIAV